MHEAIQGYPDNVDEAAASTMKDVMTAMAAFQGELRAVRTLPRAARMARAKELVAQYWKPPVTPPTALALLLTLKNCAEIDDDWKWMTDFIGKLPQDIADQEEVRELAALAASSAGKPMEAIAQLEALVDLSGPTPERLGMLGGRYKRLLKTATTPAEKLQCLSKAIDSYERGMELDLNQYYCSCNLPRLYRQRRRKGDEERAKSVSNIVVAACERARKRGAADEWLRPTLLGASFDSADCDKAEELAEDVAAEGAVKWKLDTILADLESSVTLVEDKACQDRLAVILEDLKRASGG